MSLVEKTAKKLLPIYRELHKKLIPMKKGSDMFRAREEDDDFDIMGTEVVNTNKNADQ